MAAVPLDLFGSYTNLSSRTLDLGHAEIAFIVKLQISLTSFSRHFGPGPRM